MSSLSFRFALRYRVKAVVVVPDPVQIQTLSLADGRVGLAYDSELTASGGTPPYTWSVVSPGTLPEGLTLNPATGTVSGTPTTEQSSSFIIRVVDSSTEPDVHELAYTINILPVLSGTHAYFDSLVARADMLRNYEMRSQAQIDCDNRTTCGVQTTGRGSAIPLTYSAVHDACQTEIKPRINTDGTSINGTTDGEGRYLKVDFTGGSMLYVWDFKVDDEFDWTVASMFQHKAWAILGPNNSQWITIKQNYKKAKEAAQGIAKLDFTSNGDFWSGTGTSNPSEIYAPIENEFYAEANRWTRVWVFLEGNVGGGVGGEQIQMSAWGADTVRDPIRIYNRINLFTPAGGFYNFKISYDASQESAATLDDVNISHFHWNRNIVVLTGITMSQVAPLLVKPS